jgi:hypothetical protein
MWAHFALIGGYFIWLPSLRIDRRAVRRIVIRIITEDPSKRDYLFKRYCCAFSAGLFSFVGLTAQH